MILYFFLFFRRLQTSRAMWRCYITTTITIVLALATGCSSSAEDLSKALPDQRQTNERAKAIGKQEIARSGALNIEIFKVQGAEESETSDRRIVSYVLNANTTEVADTDIRGMLDGRTKYPYNQATAYHMRVGRRISGLYKGELELKRSLIKWQLPPLPPRADIHNATLSVWVEGFSKNSPLSSNAGQILPLHLYAYPITNQWDPGKGGIYQDSFSRAAPGEASWNYARAGTDAWGSPGALGYIDRSPLATGIIEKDNQWISMSGSRLSQYLEHCIKTSKTFDVLLKLDDQEEDNWGTEVALLSSNFGDDKDRELKKPKLILDVSVPNLIDSSHEEFVFESGGTLTFPPIRKGPGKYLINAYIDSVTPHDAVDPVIYVRGGPSYEQYKNTEWERFTTPVQKEWQSFQVKIASSPTTVRYGEHFAIELLEPWVSPGPPEKQVPELLLIAPSGKRHRVDGILKENFKYKVDFLPDELGLWKYGWSFLPRAKSPRGSHQGEGVFFVDTPNGTAEWAALESYAGELVRSLSHKKRTGPSDQYKINSFVRWSSAYAVQGPEQMRASAALIEKVRQAVPHSFYE